MPPPAFSHHRISASDTACYSHIYPSSKRSDPCGVNIAAVEDRPHAEDVGLILPVRTMNSFSSTFPFLCAPGACMPTTSTHPVMLAPSKPCTFWNDICVIGMHVNARWWIRPCLKYQVCQTSQHTVPSFICSCPAFRAEPSTSFNSAVHAYILLFTDHFGRRAHMFAATAAEFTVKDTADILVNKSIALWGSQATLHSDNGMQSARSSRAGGIPVPQGSRNRHQLVARQRQRGYGACKLQSVPIAVDGRHKRQNGWEVHVPDAAFAYNNGISAAIRLVPSKGHTERLPRFSLTIFESCDGGGRQSLNRHITAY